MSKIILLCAKRAGMEHNCKEPLITCAAIAVCIFSLCLVYRDLSAATFAHGELQIVPAVQAISFAVLVTLLVFGGLVYLFARIGYLRRNGDLISPPRSELERVY